MCVSASVGGVSISCIFGVCQCYVLSMSNILSMFAALCVEGPPFPYIYIHTHELSLTRIISLSSSLSLALRFGAWGRAIEWGSKEKRCCEKTRRA